MYADEIFILAPRHGDSLLVEAADMSLGTFEMNIQFYLIWDATFDHLMRRKSIPLRWLEVLRSARIKALQQDFFISAASSSSSGNPNISSHFHPAASALVRM